MPFLVFSCILRPSNSSFHLSPFFFLGIPRRHLWTTLLPMEVRISLSRELFANSIIRQSCPMLDRSFRRATTFSPQRQPTPASCPCRTPSKQCRPVLCHISLVSEFRTIHCAFGPSVPRRLLTLPFDIALSSYVTPFYIFNPFLFTSSPQRSVMPIAPVPYCTLWVTEILSGLIGPSPARQVTGKR